jgi:hypothetical protein
VRGKPNTILSLVQNVECVSKRLRLALAVPFRLIFGDDAPERQRNSQRNLIEGRTIYWMITAERPKL